MDDAENKKKNCGRGVEYRRMWVNRRPETDWLWVGFEFIENGEMHCANPLTFKVTPLYETDYNTAMCTIDNEMATQLMDDLWKAGIRPTAQWEYKGSKMAVVDVNQKTAS